MQATTATVCLWRGLIHPWDSMFLIPHCEFFFFLLPNESRNDTHLNNMPLRFACLFRHVSTLHVCVSLQFSVCALDGIIRPAEITIIINPHYKSKQCSMAPILFSFNPAHVILLWWPAAEPNNCWHQLAISLSLLHIAVCIIIHVAQYVSAAHGCLKFYLKL